MLLLEDANHHEMSLCYKIIKMENIAEKQTENFIKFFATATFKCNDIKYHKQTKNVQSMYFEQINN